MVESPATRLDRIESLLEQMTLQALIGEQATRDLIAKVAYLDRKLDDVATELCDLTERLSEPSVGRPDPEPSCWPAPIAAAGAA